MAGFFKARIPAGSPELSDVANGKFVISGSASWNLGAPESAVFVSQVIVMLSRTSSRVRPSLCPWKTREISS